LTQCSLCEKDFGESKSTASIGMGVEGCCEPKVKMGIYEDGMEGDVNTAEYKAALFKAVEDGDPNGSMFGKTVSFYISKSGDIGMEHSNNVYQYKDRVKRINDATFALNTDFRVVKTH
ncbi:MAG: hypothetical protein DRH32_10530, partial [Deltaproteobacteria bacterium]